MNAALAIWYFLTFSLGVGYSDGAATEAQLAFALRHKALLFETGLAADYNYRTLHPADFSTEQPATDSQQIPYTLLSDYTERTSRYHLATLKLPVMIGFEKGRFHLLAGVKPALRVYGQEQSAGMLTTRGLYDPYMDILSNMPNHGFLTAPYSETASMPLRFTAYAGLEMGVRLSEHTRLALSADYRLLPESYDSRPVSRLEAMLKFQVWLGKAHRKPFPCRCME